MAQNTYSLKSRYVKLDELMELLKRLFNSNFSLEVSVSIGEELHGSLLTLLGNYG